MSDSESDADGASAAGATDAGLAPPAAVRRRCGRRPATTVPCQVPSCPVDLVTCDSKNYYRRYRICTEHCVALCLDIGGTLQRFCQQCARFHDLSCFEGERRSCKEALARHRSKRRSTGGRAGGAPRPAPAPRKRPASTAAEAAAGGAPSPGACTAASSRRESGGTYMGMDECVWRQPPPGDLPLGRDTQQSRLRRQGSTRGYSDDEDRGEGSPGRCSSGGSTLCAVGLPGQHAGWHPSSSAPTAPAPVAFQPLVAWGLSGMLSPKPSVHSMASDRGSTAPASLPPASWGEAAAVPVNPFVVPMGLCPPGWTAGAAIDPVCSCGSGVAAHPLGDAGGGWAAAAPGPGAAWQPTATHLGPFAQQAHAGFLTQCVERAQCDLQRAHTTPGVLPPVVQLSTQHSAPQPLAATLQLAALGGGWYREHGPLPVAVPLATAPALLRGDVMQGWGAPALTAALEDPFDALLAMQHW